MQYFILPTFCTGTVSNYSTSTVFYWQFRTKLTSYKSATKSKQIRVTSVLQNKWLQKKINKIAPVLRSRHFFGLLRLRKSEVPEPTPAPTKLGRLRLQAKKWRLQASSVPYTKNFSFWTLTTNEIFSLICLKLLSWIPRIKKEKKKKNFFLLWSPRYTKFSFF